MVKYRSSCSHLRGPECIIRMINVICKYVFCFMGTVAVHLFISFSHCAPSASFVFPIARSQLADEGVLMVVCLGCAGVGVVEPLFLCWTSVVMVCVVI